MSAPTPSTKSFFYVPADGTPVAVPDLASALEALRGGGYLWLNLLDPAREDLEALASPFGLHPLAIEDCLDDEQMPKIEDYPTNTFILFNKFHYEERELFIDEVDLFLGKNFIILVSHNMHGDPSFLDRLEQMAGLERENVLQGADYLLHVILDYLVDQKFETIGALRDELDEIEEQIISDIGGFRPEELLGLRRNLLKIRKTITYEREILVKICRKDSHFVNEKSIYEFRDIYDHLAKFFEETDIYREMISSFMEMYLSMMNNRMSMMANRTNRIVRRLTMITTIFMPMTLLSGIGGMSEWSMMTGPENWRMAYPLFLAIMMLVGIGSYIILKKLESRDSGTDE